MKEPQRGLTKQQVQERIEKGLVNKTLDMATKTRKQIWSGNIFTFFNVLNAILAISVAAVHSYRNMLFMGVVLSNMMIGIVQETKAKKMVDKLSILVANKVKVIRDGTILKISIEEIVQDDWMLLESGNQICADSVVIEGECQVNESMLTGESEPVLKRIGDTILSGSYVTSGTVQAKVIHVGKENYVNQIVRQAKKIKKVKSEMMTAIRQIIKVISFFILPMGMFMFWKQRWLLTQPLERAVTNTVAAMIGMIPEGLVLLSSMVLAVSVVRLGKEKALVQELYCIETLARVDVLCLDKTGTITEGSMEVEEVISLQADNPELALQALASALQDNNPTFLALQERFHQGTNWNTRKIIPFSSDTKWSLAAFEQQGSYILGAPECILKENITLYKSRIEYYAKKGKRVLLLAHSMEIPQEKELPGSLQPMAFILIRDKIRKDAKKTLQYFKNQGIELKIISGDNPTTVLNIAKEAGLESSKGCLDASSFPKEQEIKNVVEDYTVFGRVTPDQKLEIVKALQGNGHIVAMTGDGVNDVLALKEADCSIAMESGSDAARKTAQIVLLDSCFSAMPKILAEGRRAINNLERSATLFLVKTIYAFLLAAAYLILKRPYPFMPIQLTLISALAIGIPSFLLALEPNYNLVKGKFIYNVLGKAFPGGLLVVTNVAAAAYLAAWKGCTLEQTTTLATFAVAMASMYVLYQICKPFDIKRAIMFASLVLAFVLAVSLFRTVFVITTLSRIMCAILIGLGAFNIVIYRIYEYLVLKIITRPRKA